MDQAYIGGKFTIPPNFDFNILPHKDRKICVVSIIGQSDLFFAENKGSHIEDDVLRNAFSRFGVGFPDPNPVTIEDGISENGIIEGFYHPEKQVIYLHLKGIYDTSRMADLCDVISQDNVKYEDIANMISQEDFHYAKLVLYLFHISHLVAVSTIGCDLDTTYIRFFKFIDNMRNKLLSQMIAVLRILAVSREWCNFGRPCSPRILFVFNLPPSALAKSLARAPDKLYKFQQTLEDKIFNVFRKIRLVTDTSNNCLFAIPSKQSFVTVCLPTAFSSSLSTRRDRSDYFLQKMLARSSISGGTGAASRVSGLFGAGASSEQHDTSSGTITNSGTADDDCGDGKEEGRVEKRLEELGGARFARLIESHVAEALTGRGFDDNKGRHPLHAVFELPSCRAWFKVCHKLYTAMMTEQAEAGIKSKMNHASQLYDVRNRLSNARCRKALPLAETRYREDLPPHYSRAIHLSKVVLARRFFLTCARGPCTADYLDKLEALCDRVWLTGRQMCDAVSINGQPCRYEVHRLPPRPSSTSSGAAMTTSGKGEESDTSFSVYSSASRDHHPRGTGVGEAVAAGGRDASPSTSGYNTEGAASSSSTAGGAGSTSPGEEEELPVLPHRSHFELRAACNCGKVQDHRQDPFDWWEANVEFYRRLAEVCCDKYQGLRLPPHDTDDLNDMGRASLTSTYSLEQATGGGGGGGVVVGDSQSGGEGSDESGDGGGSITDEEEEDHVDDESGEEDEEDWERAEWNQSRRQAAVSAGRRPGARESALARSRPGRELSGGDQQTGGDSSSSRGGSKKKARARVLFFGMVTERTPDWQVPLETSWSVLNVGKYFSYSHANGIEQPGFLQGSNFLLPWDVTVKSKSWIADNEYHKKSKGKIRGKPETSASTVKIFIGFEYECPIGHRFFLAGPKRMMRGAMQGCQVKEAVSGLLTRPLPLYFPCQCYQSSVKGYLAQLMRIYVALPNSPIQVALQLRVRPGSVEAGTPVFSPGGSSREPLMLSPGNLWVARLPAAYQDENRIYRMPQDPSAVDQCQLIKGALSHLELVDDPPPLSSRKTGGNLLAW